MVNVVVAVGGCHPMIANGFPIGSTPGMAAISVTCHSRPFSRILSPTLIWCARGVQPQLVGPLAAAGGWAGSCGTAYA